MRVQIGANSSSEGNLKTYSKNLTNVSCKSVTSLLGISHKEIILNVGNALFTKIFTAVIISYYRKKLEIIWMPDNGGIYWANYCAAT